MVFDSRKKIAFLTGLAVLAIGLYAAFSARTHTPPFREASGSVVKGSIAEQRRIELGNWSQYVLIRGRDRTAPLLVFLHGGPGTTEMPMTRLYNAELENDFVFVNWDQRGTGKSYSHKLDPSTLTLEQLTNDLDELIDLLRTEFKQDKVLLVCHSWGTHLGMEYVTRHPDKIVAYVGVGQISNPIESDRLGTEWVLAQARRAGDQKAVQDLERFGADAFSINETILQRKYIWRYGGAFHEPKSVLEMVRVALKAPEVSWLDFIAFRRGTEFSLESLWSDIMKIDAERDYPKFDIPVYFMLGRYDQQVSAILAAQYFNSLEAPQKKLIWFEKSGHAPPFEESDKFNAEIKQIGYELGLLTSE